MRLTRDRMCRGKQRHASEGKAEAAIRSLCDLGKGKNAETLNAYYCWWCRHWHVGHKGPDELSRK